MRVHVPEGPLLLGRKFLPREQRLIEAEFREIADPHRVEDAVEVVALVLHHARVKSLDRALEAVAVLVKAGVAQTAPARHPAAHSRDREAAFPALFDFVG